MFGFAWLTLRQAQEALRNGRLEEALRLVELPAVRNHRRAGELLAQLARAYLDRGEQRLKADDAEVAWADLLQGELLGAGPRAAERLRQGLTSLAIAEARALRTRAWRALQPATVSQAPPGEATEAGPAEPLPPRFFLWIDGVGGYLVCLGARLTFGQALPEARVDVPLVADVSRLHAT